MCGNGTDKRRDSGTLRVGRGVRRVQTPELSVIEERMPPGASEQRHSHEFARQFFYVLAGELTMEVNGVVHVLTAGMGLEIGPGQAHQAINRSDEKVRFLVVSQPQSQADRVSA
jgi:quercetin dioxygenase-like cupin family protein